jgi:hypothetical protein
MRSRLPLLNPAVVSRRIDYAGRLPMNAVVFTLMFLLLIEWLADRFAGRLAKRWSMSRDQDAIPPITAR